MMRRPTDASPLAKGVVGVQWTPAQALRADAPRPSYLSRRATQDWVRSAFLHPSPGHFSGRVPETPTSQVGGYRATYIVAPSAWRPERCILPKMFANNSDNLIQRWPCADMLQLGKILISRPIVEQVADAGHERIRAEDHLFQGFCKR